ncbi:uncharacterized protein LOC129914544 [Episyrphus balteatus]|uniref:uncharacterized protein LOC129914544 n=1 Tax=Episyrphus balteatus TaxID=286459 RepID=UPI00248657A7|nr:uncharacterized protein LOC129914544 [Episyrphus balteatus]
MITDTQLPDDIVDHLVMQIETNNEKVEITFKPEETNETQQLNSKTENTSLSHEEKRYKKKRKYVPLPKDREFYASVIPSMTPDDFRIHFRMTRTCLQSIMNRVGNRCRIFSMEKKFLFTIWMLSTRESFAAVGTRFCLSKGASHQYFCDIIDGLIVLFKEYVSWPDTFELTHIEQGFKPKTGGYVPGIVGAISSCHLLIKKPARYSIYCNPMQSHSIVLQGVCDHQKIFTDVYVGAPGCLNAERVYKNSPLSKQIDKLIPEDFHIVGNIYFPQKQNLVVPLLDYEILSEPQKQFNTHLSKANSIIEEAFQLLLGRFRRLTFLDTSNPEMANRMVIACIILHNHILMTDLDEDPQLFLKEPVECFLNVDYEGNTASDDDVQGIIKRNYLLSLFEYV